MRLAREAVRLLPPLARVFSAVTRVKYHCTPVVHVPPCAAEHTSAHARVSRLARRLATVHTCKPLAHVPTSFMSEFSHVGAHCAMPSCKQQGVYPPRCCTALLRAVRGARSLMAAHVWTCAPHPSRVRADFLPFKCEACGGQFCLEHRSPAAHACSAHVPTGSAATGAVRDAAYDALRLPCIVSTCGRREAIPLACALCRQPVCLAHRDPDAHACAHGAGEPPRAATRVLSGTPSLSGSVHTSSGAGASSVGCKPLPAVRVKDDASAALAHKIRMTRLRTRAQRPLPVPATNSLYADAQVVERVAEGSTPTSFAYWRRSPPDVSGGAGGGSSSSNSGEGHGTAGSDHDAPLQHAGHVKVVHGPVVLQLDTRQAVSRYVDLAAAALGCRNDNARETNEAARLHLYSVAFGDPNPTPVLLPMSATLSSLVERGVLTDGCSLWLIRGLL
ncbi:hypothetical protein EON68_00800 [archaeon]|nr:MAG: hypothetical protein EON68_00800 [archaeon]